LRNQHSDELIEGAQLKYLEKGSYICIADFILRLKHLQLSTEVQSFQLIRMQRAALVS
jgi:hypothetical protein